MAMHPTNPTTQPILRIPPNRFLEIPTRLLPPITPPNLIHHPHGPTRKVVIGNNFQMAEPNGGMETPGNHSDANQNGHED